MFRRLFATLLTATALLSASGAWAGWLFQHTAGDPARSQQLASAVISDPTARHEVAGDLTAAVAGAANNALTQTFGAQAPIKIDSHDPQVQRIVESVLADPQFSGTITSAVAAAHANALGVGTPQPVVVDSGMVTAAAKQYLSTVNPTLAAQIPTIPSIPIKLPAAEIPIASRLRATTDAWVPRLELVAVACLIGALVFGERHRVARRAGLWAIGAGISWLLTPALVTWAADTWVPGHGAIVHALFRGVDGSVNTVATNFIVMGGITTVLTIVYSILLDRRRVKPTPVVATVADTHVHPDAARRFGYGRDRDTVHAPAPTAARR